MSNKKELESSRTTMQYLLATAKYAGGVYLPVLQTLKYNDKLSLPPIENIMLFMPVIELAEQIRKQEITSVQVVQAYVDRIKAVNPVVNAVIDERFDAALGEAREKDELCKTLSKEELQEKYPLLGVPFTVKEPVGVKGMSFHVGAHERKDMRCEEDSVVIQNLRNAGAIPVAVSNIPEWCLAWETNNTINGRTLNPYDTTHSPGGSSGGEAALISSAASVFGIGTDFAGSIRLPAMFTGIYGLRPTRPVISIEGALPDLPEGTAENIFSIGPMCRYAKDLTLITKIMAGHNAQLLNLDEPIDFKQLKVYQPKKYSTTIDSIPIKEEILEGLQNVVEALREAGSEIYSTHIFIDGLFEILTGMYLNINSSRLIEISSIPNYKGACAKEYVKWAFGMSNHSLFAIHSQVLIRHRHYSDKLYKDSYAEKQKVIEAKLKEVLDNNSILLIPTFPTAAFKHLGSSSKISGMVYVMLAAAFNLPAINIPLGLNKDGLPIGVQVVAGKYQDRLCIEVAKYIEQKLGGWVPPPSK